MYLDWIVIYYGGINVKYLITICLMINLERLVMFSCITLFRSKILIIYWRYVF